MQSLLSSSESGTNFVVDLPITFVGSLAQLRATLSDGVDAAIWDRTVPETVLHWLDSCAPDDLPEGRFVLDPLHVAEAIADLFATTRNPPCPAQTWLADDAKALALEVQRLSKTDLVRLRLEPVFDDACSKLHVDNVVNRMICTYRGPGTVLGLEAAPESATVSIPTGAPVILKGTQWPADELPILRHRSPRIAGTGISRLVLVIEGCSSDDINPAYDRVYPSNQV